ncbi:MAG: PBS lyase heat protein [uncultured bacterium]|nr:MAG: PBS lyase heat protein [uncultured bacterium]
MLENKKEILSELLEELHAGKCENSDGLINKLNELEAYPRDEVVEMINFLITQDATPQALFHVVKTIGKYNDESSINPLIELLLLRGEHKEGCRSPEDFIKVRCLITNILSNLKDNKAVMPLLYVLNNKEENYKLRLSSAEALGRIGDKYAVIPLIDIVSNEEEKSVYLRESAAKALGMLNDIRAVDPLIRILESKKGIMDKFTFLKEKVIEAIGQIGFQDDKTIKALSSALMDESPFIRLSAIETLAELNDDRTFDLIEPMIKDEEEDVARCAINALYNIAGKDYIINLAQKPDLAGWCKDEIEMILEEENEEYDKEYDKYE